MIKWLGENGVELVRTKKYLYAKKRIFVYKLDSFVGFIGDEQVHFQECYVHSILPKKFKYFHPFKLVRYSTIFANMI
jgi:hypothetical protein